MRNFLVYKSSAGSGKTTTLVKEYLKITLKNPSLFHSVLAITFTNKAANEMKSRVLEVLNLLSDNVYNHEIIRLLIVELGLSKELLSKNALKLRSLIIHRYDEFGISTIDSFVHQIVRTFSNDLKLPQGFDVILDDDDIIPFIIENIYGKIGKDKAFTEIITRFVLKKVDEEKSYDLTKNLTEFIKKQFNEDIILHGGELTKHTSDELLKVIYTIAESLRNIKNELVSIASEGVDAIEKNAIDIKSFYYGVQGVGGYLLKIKNWKFNNIINDLSPNSYVKKAINDDIWYGKSLDESSKSAIDSISPYLSDIVLKITTLSKKYIIRKLIYDKIFEWALITEIKTLLQIFIEETQQVHISEFNKRIHQEIAGQPIPFIYERIGLRYRHYLIDEFQDTSVLQWKNLLPLINESLGNGNFNMVVGDAKQAIYRFRNGEVELFTHLPRVYPYPETPQEEQIETALIANYIEESLNINYRSRENIINFNNDFFSQTKIDLGENFSKVYENHEQVVPETNNKENGLVSVRIKDVTETSIDKERQKAVKEIIEELQEKNYPLKNICILTRGNKEGASVATYLLQNGIPVVSADSLKLSASPSVRILISFLKLMSNKNNKLALSEFFAAYAQIKQDESLFYSLFDVAKEKENPLIWFKENIFNSLPDPKQLETLSVYEIVVAVARHLLINYQENLFFRFFLDFIYDKKNVCHGLEDFLLLWEEKKSGLSIVLPDGLDAVQVMTAHKAKGLKFGTVIADLYNFNNKFTKDDLWVELDIPELNNFSRGLLNISSALDKVGMGEIYNYEKSKTFLDFFNLIYVAFTRPVDALYILSYKKKKGDKFFGLLKEFLKRKSIWSDEKLQYDFGKFTELSSAVKQQKEVFTDTESKIPSDLWYNHLIIAPVESRKMESLTADYPRLYGEVIHEILSEINTIDDVENVVNLYLLKGLVDKVEIPDLIIKIKKTIEHPDIAAYYQKGLHIKNESEIFDFNTNKIFRPDRIVIINNKLVIIDYKTGEKRKEHYKQLENYATIFLDMGYDKIEKKLVYLNQDIYVETF